MPGKHPGIGLSICGALDFAFAGVYSGVNGPVVLGLSYDRSPIRTINIIFNGVDEFCS